MSRSKPALLVLVALFLFALPAVADAATLAVDDNGAQCPAAQFRTIQAAVDAAAPGDTVAVCPGTYVEGTGAVGTNALTITKSLTIKGAGADLVSIEPARSTPTGGQIAEPTMDIRDRKGDIVLAAGATGAPIDVAISGVTVDGNGVFAKAGIVYLDAEGELVRDRVTGIATSISNTAYELPGGYRSNEYGYGIAQVTAAHEAPAGLAPRPLIIDHTRVDSYNKLGILIDGGTGAGLPVVPSGIVNEGRLEADQVVGRVECLPFNTPKPPPYVLGGAGATPTNELPGNCSLVQPTTVGPTFGQDGVRVAGGASVDINDSTISQNLVNGEASPVYSYVKEEVVEGKRKKVVVPVTTDNANLSMAAGVRLLGAGASTVSNSNITDNGYGVVNLNEAGTAPATANPIEAANDWWGLWTEATANTGPAVSPTVNPFAQENPVNGTASGEGSDAVHFKPFRGGSESDPDAGEWPVIYAPLPVDDAPPTISLATDKHDYDRGQTVQLTATASDDFGVTSITFYDGATAIGTVTPPAATATLAIPADAACTTSALSAVATDFLGQTGSGSTEIAVTGPNDCKETTTPPPPPPPTPKPPTVSLSAPKSIGAKGATVSATANADAGAGASVAKVEFFLGNTSLCTDDKGPYNCKLVPSGDQVGRQTLRAVVTDSKGQTASAQAGVTIEKFSLAGFPIKVKAARVKKPKPRLVRTLSGKLKLPARVTRAEACTSGTITVTVTRGKEKVLPPTQVSLHRDCSWKLRFTAMPVAKSKFIATAKFGGNTVLKPASSVRRFH